MPLPEVPVHYEESVRVLLIEDDEDDVVMTRALLREIEGIRYELEWISEVEAGLNALEAARHDVCLVDYRLGTHDGIAFLTEAIERGCRIPIILLTGQADHAVDLAAMRAGAADFLSKAQISAQLLERSIRYSIQQKRSEAQRIQLSAEQAARREAEAASRAKDQFLAMLAHELRNPLAAIASALQLLRSPAEAEQAQWALEVGERQVGHLVRLIDDLLDVSRITQGKIQLEKRPLAVSEIVQRAVESVRPQVERRRHNLLVSITSEPLWVEADPTRLEQVAVNLLTNASKYTDEGGRIEIAVRREGEEAVIRVRDNGIGMSPEMVSHVFELFTQIDHSLDRSQGGLGIGLTLVRSLVRMHGGDVTAHSEGPGRGSEFVVRLPTRPAPVKNRPAPAAAPCINGSKRRILVVDDNRDAAKMLGTLLTIQGHDVEIVHDGPKAVSAVRQSPPDVVLLDIGLPEMDGYEVARRMRELPGFNGTLLVALTGYGRAEDRQRSEEAGFDAHLVKPVSQSALQDVLSRAAARCN